MKESHNETPPDLDEGWDEIDSSPPPSLAPASNLAPTSLHPSSRSPNEVNPELGSVDAGWEDDDDDDDADDADGDGDDTAADSAIPDTLESELDGGWDEVADSSLAASPVEGAPRAVDKQRGKRPREVQTQVLDSAHRTLNKKERRELERRQRAHAEKQKAERKKREKQERDKKRSEERARAEQAANAARAKKQKAAKAKAKAKAKTQAQSQTDAGHNEPTTRAEIPSTKRLDATRSKSKPARDDAPTPSRERKRSKGSAAPWIVAVALLAVILFLLFARR